MTLGELAGHWQAANTPKHTQFSRAYSAPSVRSHAEPATACSASATNQRITLQDCNSPISRKAGLLCHKSAAIKPAGVATLWLSRVDFPPTRSSNESHCKVTVWASPSGRHRLGVPDGSPPAWKGGEMMEVTEFKVFV
ncbi:unnamed protein product [Arctogadus glacialis]